MRLQGREIPIVHVNTNDFESVPSYQIDYPDGEGGTICFNVKEGTNVGGEDDDKEDYWGELCQKSDLIFYLLDIDRLSNELKGVNVSSEDERSLRRRSSSLKRLSSDMRFISGTAFNTQKNSNLVIVLNKIDVPLETSSGDTLEEKLQNYGEDIQAIKGIVEQIARDRLGVHKNNLKGVLPLSCKDDEMFAQFFPVILKKLAGA